jgi:hypothetical protein
MIHKCQKIIIGTLKERSPECVVLMAKNRIDETNIKLIPDLCEKLLTGKEKDDVLKALSFLKRGLVDICQEHGQWALEIGEMYGRAYHVSEIDSPSLALEGLYKAAIRFQPNGSFKSYATSWIRQCIQRYIDHNMVYTLNSPIKQGESSTHIEQLSYDDVVWGNSTFYGRDPFALEELRLKYCDHLSLDEVRSIVENKELAEANGC